MTVPTTVDISEAARRIGISPYVLYRRIQAGILPPGAVIRFGPRRLWINVARFETSIADGGVPQ